MTIRPVKFFSVAGGGGSDYGSTSSSSSYSSSSSDYSSSSSSGGGDVSAFGLLIALVIIATVVFWPSSKRKLHRRSQVAGEEDRPLKPGVEEAPTALPDSPALDDVTNTAALARYAEATFLRFQSEWSANDTTHFASYMTAAFAERNELLITALNGLGRQNIVRNPSTRVSIKNTRPQTDTSPARFTAHLSSRAHDILNEINPKSTLYSSLISFSEQWEFVFEDGKWRLAGITPSTADTNSAHAKLQQLAHDHRMHYSLDMGWLLLPKRGRLFTLGLFGKSDINNHVIGKWDNLLVQLYTYRPHGTAPTHINVVGQISVPKSYGGIIIQPKRHTLARLLRHNHAPRGYKKYTFEWEDFNSRYEVYATDGDRLAAFELVNPKFMVDLYDADKNLSIEVVDTVVYIYKHIGEGLVGDDALYRHMLQVLKTAHKELSR